jgi:hypothetical protein
VHLPVHVRRRFDHSQIQSYQRLLGQQGLRSYGLKGWVLLLSIQLKLIAPHVHPQGCSTYTVGRLPMPRQFRIMIPVRDLEKNYIKASIVT